MQKKDKKQFVEEFKQEVENAESVVLANYQGLDVNSVTELRIKLKENDCVMKVVKNRLARRAFKDIGGYDGIIDYLTGPTAVLLGLKDPSAGVKAYEDFMEDDNDMEFKAAVINENLLDAEKLHILANLPSRKVLLGQVVNVANAPVQNLYSGLKTIIQKLLYALNEHKENLETESGNGDNKKNNS